MNLDMSGQMSALKTRVCKPGEKVSILITDGNNNPVVESTKTITSPSNEISFATLMSGLGINAAPTDTVVQLSEHSTQNTHYM